MKHTLVSSAVVGLLLAGLGGGVANAQATGPTIKNNAVPVKHQSPTQQQTTQQTQTTTQQQSGTKIQHLNLGPGYAGTIHQQQSNAATPQQGTARGH